MLWIEEIGIEKLFIIIDLSGNSIEWLDLIIVTNFEVF